MHRYSLPLAIALVTAPVLADEPPAPRQVTLKFGHREPQPFNPQRWLFSPEVVADKSGTVRLARSVLITNEVGATDHHQIESLSDRVRARTSFWRPSTREEVKDITKAELFAYGDPKEIEFNGKSLTGGRRHPSTGWTRVEVPLSHLRAGEDTLDGNAAVLRGGGTVLFEPRQESVESEKSTDAGNTWSRDKLGASANLHGEYLVRLRLGAQPGPGRVQTPTFDFWSVDGGAPSIPGRCDAAALEGLHARFPDRRLLPAYIRLGRTPTPDTQNWTGWLPLADLAAKRPELERPRWFQLRVEFSRYRTSDAPAIPPEFQFSYQFTPDPVPAAEKLTVNQPAADHPPRLTSVPFIYQKPSPRLKYLREKYELDKVIAPGKTEMEQLVLLRHWVRNQWHTAWGNHPAAWMPPWDALQILACKDQPDCLTMCTHYACVFTQCCLALGWNARHCILDHHCVSEVWVDQHQKWVMMDAGNSKERPDCNLHFERGGVPLSALQLHLAYRDKKTDGTTVCFTPKRLMEAIAPLCRSSGEPGASAPGGALRPDTVPIAELKNYPVCGLENYRRYAFPARNNYLESLYPGELYQGWAEYFYDGYWWVGDERDDPQLSPEYSKHLPPSRPQDIDWDLNWTCIHLCRTKTPGELQVDLETFTPNLERLEIARGNASEYKPTPASFVWKLEPGKNVLRARSVNAWGRTGRPAEATVEWKPAK
jgi:hypothetical protein